MRRGMRKLHGFKVRQCAARLFELNKYLDLFPGTKLSEKIGVTELDFF